MRRTNISTKEQTELIRKYKETGDEETQLKIIESCLVYLECFIARKIPYRGETQKKDLISEGICGLLDALERFDLSKGFTFLTYAKWYIEDRVREASKMEYSPVTIPMCAINDIQKLKNIRNNFYFLNSRYPTSREMSVLSGFSEKRVELLVNQSLRPLEIDDKQNKREISLAASPDNADFLSDIMYDDKIQEMVATIGKLDARDQDIINRRFGLGGKRETLKKIGDDYGVSVEAVRLWESKILKKLKNELTFSKNSLS